MDYISWPVVLTVLGGALTLAGAVWTAVAERKTPPIVLTVLAGLLSLAGAAGTARQQAKTAEEGRLAHDKALRITQQIAARIGDQKILDELIETRTRLLATDRRTNDDMIEKIVAQLPKLTEDYGKLQQDTARARAGKETEFRLGWEPFIRFAVAEFDKRIAELRANGINEVSGGGGAPDTFPITNVNPSTTNVSYGVRAVRFGEKSVLFLDYNSYFPATNTHPEQPGVLFLRVGAPGTSFPDPFSISMNLIEGKMMPGGRAIKTPQDGMVSAEMTDAYRGALAKAIEQALVVLRTETK